MVCQNVYQAGNLTCHHVTEKKLRNIFSIDSWCLLQFKEEKKFLVSKQTNPERKGAPCYTDNEREKTNKRARSLKH